MLGWLLILGSAAQGHAPQAIHPLDWLVIEPIDKTGRRPFRPDAVFEAHLLDRSAPLPTKERSLKGELGVERFWQERHIKAGERVSGELAYAFTSLAMDKSGVWMAELSGAGRLWVNGTPFVGDLYGLGLGAVPVELREGANSVFVSGVRGSFELVFREPPRPEFIADTDRTVPDAEADSAWCGLVHVNATTERSERLRLPPLSIEKRPVLVQGARENGQIVVEWPDALSPIRLRVVEGGAHRRRSFLSHEDESVQDFGFLPAEAPSAKTRTLLSLHGAGVDCWGQIRSYSPKPGIQIIAPTNRRQFGFDWQDWGRTNAYEALEAVGGERSPRVFLSGHSMGGHGTWHLASNDPDRFLAIAPSAGWISFDSYGGRPDGELRTWWHAADGASDTLARLENLVPLPTFIIHGMADDNVPVSEARTMEEQLRRAGGAPRTHYQEGAGHWWDGDRSPGADCLDWPEAFELFEAQAQERIHTEFDWLSADPGIDDRHEWIGVQQLIEYGLPLRVRSRRVGDTLTLITQNARQLSLLDHPPEWDGSKLNLDGQLFVELPTLRPLSFVWNQGAWSLGDPKVGEKSAKLSGPFKRAFRNRFVLVYGTAGSAEENRELYERARLDAQTWWYRGNGRGILLSDEEYLALKADDRHVILYGNRDTNRAFGELLGTDAPFDARRGSIRIADREHSGNALGAVCILPARAGRKEALIGLCADSGAQGTRLGHTLATFVSGVGYPDYAVFSAEILRSGDGGVLEAGWWSARWQPQHFAFRRD
jgi:pimeloyl-ACP methyl ester carboxylesterase